MITIRLINNNKSMSNSENVAQRSNIRQSMNTLNLFGKDRNPVTK